MRMIKYEDEAAENIHLHIPILIQDIIIIAKKLLANAVLVLCFM